MRRLTGGLVMASLIAAVAGCRSPVTAGADYNTAVPFGHPVSFAWDEPDALPTGDARLDANPFFLARLHGSIEHAFGARGIRMDAVNPTLLVHHHATVRDRVQVVAGDFERGYTDSEYGAGTSVYQYEEGTFLIDIANARTKEIVWRGWATADLAGALDDPEALAALVDESVTQMFEKFPIAVGTPPVFVPPVIDPPAPHEIPWPETSQVYPAPGFDSPM